MRAFWIGFGISTHAFFAFTVCRLYPFLAGTSHGYAERFTAILPLPWYGIDLLLAVQFGVLHSWLLLPQTRQRLTRLIPAPHYGCFFCAMTCLSLLLAIEGWQRTAGGLWHLSGWPGGMVFGGFLLSWLSLVYSLHLTGLGYQTGWTPWWAWVRGRKPPPREFSPRGAYRLLRHPVYLSFLGLVWCAPLMTWDRVLLVAVWTVYILIGSFLKDQRLLHYIGAEYRDYQAQVAGYPFLRFGPLARLPMRTKQPISSRSSS